MLFLDLRLVLAHAEDVGAASRLSQTPFRSKKLERVPSLTTSGSDPTKSGCSQGSGVLDQVFGRPLSFPLCHNHPPHRTLEASGGLAPFAESNMLRTSPDPARGQLQETQRHRRPCRSLLLFNRFVKESAWLGGSPCQSRELNRVSK